MNYESFFIVVLTKKKKKVNTEKYIPKILVVDDQRIMLNLLCGILEEQNYKVLTAQDSSEAIKILNTQSIDLIILDVVMPGIDGFELCKRIKNISEWKNIPVIFVSTLTDSGDIVKGLEIGGADYILKPIRHEEFVVRVKKQLEFRNVQQQSVNQIEELRKTNRYLLGTMHEMSKVMEDTRSLN